MYCSRLSPALVIGLCLLSPVSLAKAADRTSDPDEQVLQEAHVKTDAASLRAFIQHHTGKDEDLQNLGPLVRRLSSSSFNIPRRCCRASDL